MDGHSKKILLLSTPFAGTSTPSIALSVLKYYLKEKGINVDIRHIFLKAAEFYGLKNYNSLIYSPNIPYMAQMIFSKYLFPNHWDKNENKFRNYFNENIKRNYEIKKVFSFEDYVDASDNFYNWVFENISWESYDLVGFTLNYGQFLPSLAISKKVKELHPDIEIVFGGSRAVGEIGKGVLSAFDFVDFVVSGDGEESLYQLAINFDNYSSIPNLIYRNKDNIISNELNSSVDIDNSPFHLYDDFFQELSYVSGEIGEYFNVYGSLPIEFSRGCWWNKCSFCNLNLQYSNYREKSVECIVRELVFLSDRYKILNFHVVGNALSKHNLKSIIEEIKSIGKDFSFTSEARAGHINSDDYRLLKEAGFNSIQTGIESFSSNYLKKMNKGVRVIDNIAALKFCKENGIKNLYNIIVGYPNEEKIDYDESLQNVSLIRRYLDPPNISFLTVGYGSPIHCNPDFFNIKSFDFIELDKLMFPETVLSHNINFYFNFKRILQSEDNDWKSLVEKWKDEREKLMIEKLKSGSVFDELVFYFDDGGDFLRIYDKRENDVQIYVLDEIEREVFLSCLDVVSFEELCKKLTSIPDFKLAAILHTFEKIGIVYHEDNLYLSLPLRHNILKIKIKQREESLAIN